MLCYCRVLPVVVRDVATRMSVSGWRLKRSSLHWRSFNRGLTPHGRGCVATLVAEDAMPMNHDDSASSAYRMNRSGQWSQAMMCIYTYDLRQQRAGMWSAEA